MWKFVSSYFVFEALVIAAAVGFTLWNRRRRLKHHNHRAPAGFVKTEETFFDPTTGIKQRVWFNPRTGERFYETMEG